MNISVWMQKDVDEYFKDMLIIQYINERAVLKYMKMRKPKN